MILPAARLSVAIFLSFRFFIDNYLVMCEVLSCSPAEIGSDHEVKFNVTNKCSGGVPRLESYEGVYSKCPKYTIREDVKERYNVTLSKQNSDYNILTLLIYNISLPTAGQVVYFNLNEDNTSENGNCNISVYRKADDLNCTFNITNEGLKVVCLSSEIYPDGPCAFDSNLKNGTFRKEDVNLNSSSKSPYVTKKCRLEVPVANLAPGLLMVNVTVYPNVTGHVDDKYKYGTQSNKVFKLDRPSVRLDNCKPVVKEGENVTCRCERSDSSDVENTIYWCENCTHCKVSDGSVSFIANRSIEEQFYCQAENILRWKSDPVFYHPKIVSVQDQTHLDIGILMSIIEAVLLVISWIIVALLFVKLRRYSNSKVNLPTKEDAELKQIRENDDGYLTPTDVTNVNIAQQVRGDYDSIEPHHGYETIGRVGS
ncbi:unnamed protein product [Lymnaea stagnalis]|uniref:Ig-like domain-containing protein n=1 Tax=Lymnaea stagnalis TaxID=6523 RepID=A0AAV2HND0_LYMST